MKKRSILALLLIAALTLAGCGSGKSSSTQATSSAYDGKYYDAAPAEAPMAAEEAAYVAGDYDYSLSNEPRSAAKSESEAEPDFSEKIIYNADITLETTEFDSALEKILALVNELGGYVESSSVSGSNYSSISRGNAGTRSAYYTLRVPSANFDRFTGGMTELGNVPNSRTYTRNVTREYYDIQSRLEAYRVQEKRLLEMLSIAETVEDMLAIQRELTDVQYELDSLTGTLRYYDNQVGYSTVELEVREVREYTPEPAVKLTYWQRMSRDFRQSLKDTGHFFTELFLWLVTSLPWLVPAAAVIAGLIALLRRAARRDPEKVRVRQERREAKRKARLERRAAKKGQNKE